VADELPLDPVSIDVGGLVQRTVASLYSHLVTRPTGRAVRMAIEAQLAEVEGRALTLVDLSEVQVLDFSCADEVVAKLLARPRRTTGEHPGFFVFRGLGEVHRDPIEAVLQRQSLAAVGQSLRGGFDLLGAPSDREHRVWRTVEELGRVRFRETGGVLTSAEEREALAELARKGLVFRMPGGREYRALSRLIRDLRDEAGGAGIGR